MAEATRYMLDTNVASSIIKGPSQMLRTKLRALPLSQVCVSVVTKAELLYGLAKKPGASALRDSVASFLRHVEVLAWDEAAATVYGALRAELEAMGMPIGNLDLPIASHARSAGCVLVTHDKAFAHVPGLVVEDWLED